MNCKFIERGFESLPRLISFLEIEADARFNHGPRYWRRARLGWCGKVYDAYNRCVIDDDDDSSYRPGGCRASIAGGLVLSDVDRNAEDWFSVTL